MDNSNKINHIKSYSNNKVVLFAPPCKPSEKYPNLLATSTSEPLMATRLFYDVNPRKVQGHFCAMECVKRINDYYVFLYKDEMEGLCLGIRATQVSSEHYPTAIGRAKVDYKQNKMILDVNSFKRAFNIVQFIENHIPKAAAELKFLLTYNRFVYTKPSNTNVRLVDYDNYNALFLDANMKIITPETGIDNLSPDLLEVRAKQQFIHEYPIVEKCPAYTTNNGIDALAQQLQISFAIAKAISEGINCSIWSFCQSLPNQIANT